MSHPAAIRDLSPKIGDLAGILALFNAAGNHEVKFPKIRLQLADGTPVILSIAGDKYCRY